LAEAGIAPEELKRVASSRRRRLDSDHSSNSISELCVLVFRERRMFLSIVGAAMALCLVYCLIAPKQYESTGKVELAGAPESPASVRREPSPSGSFAAGQLQLETLANALRSEQLAWDVITKLKLHSNRGFAEKFERKFPAFNPESPSAAAKDYLLRRFRESLTVESLPHTLVLAVRFRCHDAALSATVVNEIVEAYRRQETESRMQSARGQTEWLNGQLRQMKTQIDADDLKLAEFQRAHGILGVADTSGGDRPQEVSATGALTAIETLSRDLAEATADRLQREADYRAAASGDPELVTAGDQSGVAGKPERALLQQLRGRRSELELERAQLETEHGPNYPRMAEIQKQVENADAQIKETDSRLLESLQSAWKTSAHREELVRKGLNEAAKTGLKSSGAALTYATMWQESNATRQVYMRLMQQSEEARLAAGSRGSAITVIDYAREPVKPTTPNLLLDMAVTIFVGFWLSLSAVFVKDALQKKTAYGTLLMSLLMAVGIGASYGQAPTPNTSGLPAGVAHIPQSVETKSTPDPKEGPAVWSSGTERGRAGVQTETSVSAQAIDEAPMAAGDILEVTEAHAPEMHVAVRVSRTGTVILPLAGEVSLDGTDERSAGHAIEAALIARGALLHPQVTVLVTRYAGQDVSVLGEVARPGVYSYTTHHRLLDVIATASGLTQNAGRVVTISHRSDPENASAVVLDPSGTDVHGEHNPELMPGDTVQVGRAGLVYVVGDVIRPGAFPVEPIQAITVVQALSLAWGPAQNAALKKAVLIREQAGGRTVTSLNLKRMLRGLDPDLPVRDRDILFVPDSMAKNLLNRSMESVIQSAAGVSIYSGLVYSQRF
jgi:polysaccharide export outer membrane protein